MSPAISLISNDVRQSIGTAMSDPTVQGLVDDGFINPSPHRWTMHVKHGFLSKEVRYIRCPNWNPQISDMIYAIQGKS